jgi:hypothetical protein
VTPASGTSQPPSPETVTFKDGVTTLGTGTLSGSNPDTASLTLTSGFALAGIHSLTASYGGDASFGGSTSPAYEQTVNTSGTTTTVTSITNNSTTPPPTPGEAATCPAQVCQHLEQVLNLTVSVTTANTSPPFPTGNVELLLDGAPFGTAQTLTGSAQTQQVNFDNLVIPVGHHTLGLRYVGDTIYMESSTSENANHLLKPR